MISPTGLDIRSDSEGDGHYGAPRGSRLHKGEDYLAKSGQTVVAPFDMLVVRYARPSTRFPIESGIKWATENNEGRMFYFVPNPNLISKQVKAGQVIGSAIDLTTYYGSEMSCHIHFQINK